MRVIRLTFLVTVKLLNYNAAFCKQCYSTQSNVRVRFAPSPTGLLHLGGLRTALYNYLFAKSKGGTFILRIEDTDQNRLVPGAIEQLQSDLKWVGIEPDEGPFRQSERLDLYKKEALNLIESGHAYYCFCTERRLSLLRKEAMKLRQVPKYDNKCRHLSKEEVQTKLNNSEQSCIRFKLTSGGQTFDDVVYGPVIHDVASLEGDPVIFKTDGFPTYHLANVVDDHYMNISHVLRGVEWQSSTAKHILLYKAFGWNPPYFAHLPLLVNPDGTKFSKRQGAITVQSYRNEGIYPRALVNFVTFTGGLSNLEGEPHKPRTFNIEEIIKLFNLSYVGKQPCRLMFDQLPEFNRAELLRLTNDEKSLNNLTEQLRQLVISTVQQNSDNKSVSNLQLDDKHIKAVLKWCPPRVTKIQELLKPNLMFLWSQPSLEQINSTINEQQRDTIKHLVNELEMLTDDKYNQSSLNNLLRELSKEHKLQFSKFMKALRLCLTGLTDGPAVGDTMEILGKDSTCTRLKRVYGQEPNGNIFKNHASI